MGALNATLHKEHRHSESNGIDWNFWVSLLFAVLPLVVGIALVFFSFFFSF